MNKSGLILSLETSGNVCGVALSDKLGNLAVSNVFEKNLHDKLLADMVRELLIEQKVSIDELSAVALSSGPGSFTGLRIGAALAKGICFGEKIKFISVDTMSAFAHYIIINKYYDTKRKLSVIVKSHQNIYYIQKFSINFEILSKLTTIEQDKLLSSLDNNTLLCGPGSIQLADFLDSKFDKWELSLVNTTNLKAEIIDSYARILYNENRFGDIKSFVPNYYQDFVPKTLETNK